MNRLVQSHCGCQACRQSNVSYLWVKSPRKTERKSGSGHASSPVGPGASSVAFLASSFRTLVNFFRGN